MERFIAKHFVLHRLERNLYHTFVFRTFVLISMFTIPYMGIALLILFEIEYPVLGFIFHILIILQSMICLVGTIMMIKHCRIYIFGRCFNKKIHDSSSSASHSDGIPTTLTEKSSPPSHKLPPLKI